MNSVLINLGLATIGTIAAVFVLAGVVYATVVMVDETRRITRNWRKSRARAEAKRRSRVPTQR